jgi:hypothetical protein
MQYIPHLPKSLYLIAAAAVTLSAVFSTFAEEVVQIDVKSILNTRSITTVANQKLFTWIKGVDGNGVGSYDGYMTMAASLFNGDKNPNALPDDAVVPAHGILPKVVLNYSNDDSVNNQTRAVIGIDSFTVNVPENNYSKMFIFLTSSEGTTNIRVTLTYTEGAVSSNYVVPDYWGEISATDPNFSFLIRDLAKWTKDNHMNEPSAHRIDALNVHVDSAKMLKSIKVSKTSAPSYMVFWGATGVAPKASPVLERPLVLNSDGSNLFSRTHIASVGQGLRFNNLPAKTEISIYSVTGRLVAHLFEANSGALSWNPAEKVSSGAYLCALRSGTESTNREVLISK